MSGTHILLSVDTWAKRRNTYEVVCATKWALKRAICRRKKDKYWESFEWLFGKQTHACITMILMCATTLDISFWKFEFQSNRSRYFLFYLKKIRFYASWSLKNTRDFILLVFMVSLREERQKIEAQKRMSVFPWLYVWVSCEARHRPCSFYSLGKIIQFFILFFSPIKSFWDNESEVLIRATSGPQMQGIGT